MDVPYELAARPQWVCWRIESRNGKPTKVPYAVTGKEASSTDPATWTSFETAFKRLDEDTTLDGIGYVFAEDDPYVGVDLDNCIEPETGAIANWAVQLIEELDSYTEFSPSGKGFHILIRGKLPPTGRRKGPIEMYESGRYFTVTGDHLPDSPKDIKDRAEAIKAIHKRIFAERIETTPPPRETVPIALDDRALIERACKAKNGTNFEALWRGQWDAYPSQSEAEMALCNKLAFWTGRNSGQMDRLFRLSGLMRPKWDKRRGDSTYGQQTIVKAIANCQEVYGSKPRQDKPKAQRTFPPVDAEILRGDYTLTDTGNANRFMDMYREELRYCKEMDSWLLWNGKYWERDKTNAVALTRTEKVCRALLDEGLKYEDQDKRTALVKHALRTESAGKREAIVKLAKGHTSMNVLIDDLDRDQHLLNCLNGTINLRTGEFLAHRKAALITRCIPVEYDPKATCPHWQKLIAWAMEGDARMMTYLQRAMGYSLSGLTKEQCMFVLYGHGRNGKSTVMGALMGILGDYAKTARQDLLIHKAGGSDSTEAYAMADLVSSRLVWVSETPEGGRLAESMVKALTGGEDRVKARIPCCMPFEYVPTFKVWLSTNHKPVIRGQDIGIWRRIKLIPFMATVQAGQEDRDLPDKLREEWPGILNYLIQGFIDYTRDGLQEPEMVSTATDTYRADMDSIGNFLAERCLLAGNFTVKFKSLYEAYRVWCDENGEYAKRKMEFKNLLMERGFRMDEDAGKNNILIGIGLIDERL